MPVLTPAQIAGYAAAAGFTGRDLQVAVAVALAESGGDPRQVSRNHDSHRSSDKGLWQINDYWNRSELAMGDWSDPGTNARMAYAAWRRAGWKDWVTYTSGRYLMFMPRAAAGVRAAGSPGAAAVDTSTVSGGSVEQAWSLVPVPGTPFEVPLPFDAPGNPLEAARNALDLAKGALAVLIKAGAWIGDRDNWIRVAKVIIGVALVGVAVRIIADPVVDAAEGAAGAAKRTGTKLAAVAAV